MEKNTWKGYIMSPDAKDGNGHYHWFKTFKVYNAYEQFTYQRLRKQDLEKSFTGQFLFNGFISKHPISPTINWFGVSVYDPDVILKKDNKKVLLSLQGMAMPMPYGEDEGVWKLVEQCKCKYIGLFIDEKPIYQSWTGNLPPKELVQSFLQ